MVQEVGEKFLVPVGSFVLLSNRRKTLLREHLFSWFSNKFFYFSPFYYLSKNFSQVFIFCSLDRK